MLAAQCACKVAHAISLITLLKPTLRIRLLVLERGERRERGRRRGREIGCLPYTPGPGAEPATYVA